MATVESPISDMLMTAKSREVRRGMLAELRGDATEAARHFLAAAHLELVLAADYAHASLPELAFRSRVSAASCLWRAGFTDQARQHLVELAQDYAPQASLIQTTRDDLEKHYPKLAS